MAAVMAARSSAPTPKPKRPLPPALHTSPNGAFPTSSPSPSLASKRLPPGSQVPTSAGAGSINGLMTPNGTGPKIVRRKDSTKFGDGTKPRIGRPPLETINTTSVRPVKRTAEPFVKTTSYMLKKFRKAQPSFILHLHPQYFRFDQQDGSFSYTSPMRLLLEHIKNQTVPQEMLEDLHATGIKFYECCLIVQIHDHRNTTNNTATSSSLSKNDQNQPFSIHNYNQYVTPSPHVPFPTLKTNDEAAKGSENQNKDKQPADASGDAMQGPRIFTTVLFPTAMTLHDDMMRIAAAREANVRKSGPSGQPPAKRQKTQMSKKTLENIEAETIMATAAPLYLDPVKDLGEMKQLYDKLSDPLCNRPPPAPKSRKRTVAELAADEALAAEQQSFMLIMDERLAPSSTAASTSKTTVADAEANSNATEARFERFKTLEEIKESLREKKERERENEARSQQQAQLAAQQQQQAQQAQQAAQQQAQQQAAAQLRIKMEQERAAQEANKGRELLAKKQEHLRNQQAQAQAISQQGAQHQPMQQPIGPHGHPAQSNPMIANAQAMAASQAAHSSPIVRHMTPQNAPSPAMGNMVNRPQAVPMSMSSSNQGAGSPPRPGSAIPHGHPGGVAMMQQRSQQPPSRNGTPAMVNGTPRVQQATPVMGSVTPTPRMTQASPVAHPAATPVMANGMLGAAHMNNQPQVSLQEQQRIMLHQQQQRQQAAMIQAQRDRQQMHGMPHQQLTAQQAQMLVAQQQQQQQQQQQAMAQSQQNAQDAYRANLQALQQQLNNPAGQATMNNMMASQMQQQQAAAHQAQMRRSITMMAREIFNNHINQLKVRLGGEQNIPQPQLERIKRQAMAQATNAINEQHRRIILQQQQQQQQQQQNHVVMQQQQQQQQLQQQQQQQQQAAMFAHMQRANQMNGQMNGMGGMDGI